ncbi:hypothetical protein MJG53_011130 [Ovis ammon polii x Ovis aries]|uniref:Uncharacterized protein n=1 Tax=Ovis ammon polii x Ovis aries TaxID=2918886 RepID=A0ACB9US79_9CETA|nr:hypothetical protein MJT46_010728 [Ovis ammon polii x Ovis aries]KAI4578275.1 hypothetical protein MJG53_011130 [Ovis ammon polii x Ovis aries]
MKQQLPSGGRVISGDNRSLLSPFHSPLQSWTHSSSLQLAGILAGQQPAAAEQRRESTSDKDEVISAGPIEHPDSSEIGQESRQGSFLGSGARGPESLQDGRAESPEQAKCVPMKESLDAR